MTGQYVYHFKPKAMQGNTLIPLNELKHHHSDLHDEQIKKYDGRKHVMEIKVPILNCLWNDVLHLSPINPQIILNTFLKEKLKSIADLPTREVYKIPIEMLNENKTVCFQSFNFTYETKDSDLDKFWPFQRADFMEQQNVDPMQLKVWHEDIKQGRPLYWFSHTMHVLTQQKVDISKCEVIVCKP